jgi:succinate dehydrogenase/fumarate reductase flavoprotein subunit
MCREAVPSVIELEHLGVPFSRTEAGTIYQRRFGGHTTDYAKGDMAFRACAAADRTGHAILHTLYQQCLKHQARFFIEYFAIDLLMDEDGACRGLLAWCLEDGSIHRFRANMTVIAPVAAAACINPAPRRTPAPAMATPWCFAPACRCRTWNSFSSTQRGSMARAS